MILWFTGLPRSGKTTNSQALQKQLESSGFECAIIDGDLLRKESHQDLGYSKNDRFENTRRAAQRAVQKGQNAKFVLCAFVSPYREQRQIAKKNIESAGLAFIEIYCKCPLDICEARDTKGLYTRARAGEIKLFTGVSDPYEASDEPDITLLTDSYSVEQNVEHIIRYMEEHSYLDKTL